MSEGPGTNWKTVLALLLPFASCAVQWLLWDIFKPFVWFLFYPTVYFSSRIAGKRVGIITTVVSALLTTYFFIPPQFSFAGKPFNNLLSVALFLVMGFMFSYTHERVDSAERSETAAREVARAAEERLREARIELLEAERRLDRERLQEKEEQFRIMFMESSVGEAQLDPETGSFLKVNPALCRLTGYEERQLQQLTLAEVIHPDDRQACICSLESLPACDKGGFQTELRLLRPDGQAVYGQATVNLVRDLAGRPASVLAVIQDVTERRRTEEALLKSEEKFSTAFAGNAAAIALTRLEDGVALEVNDTWVKMTGYSRQEALGRSLRHLWPTLDAVRHFQDELRKTGTLRGQEQEFINKSGEIFVTQLSSQLLTVGGEDVILSTLVDITALKQTEAALRDSEARFRTIFDAAPVAIGIGAVEDGGLIEANDSWLRLLGFERSEVIGQTAAELGLYVDENARDRILGSLREGKRVGEEVQLRRKSGEVIDVLYCAEVVVLNGRQCLLVMLSDVTVQKQAERALQKSKHDYQQLFQNMLEGFASCRMVYDSAGEPDDFVYLSVNRALLQLTGTTDMVGKRASQVIPGVRETNRDLLEACGRVARTGRSEHLEIYVPSREHWYAVSVYSVEMSSFISLWDNITPRKRAEIRRNATVELLRICNEARDLRELMSRAAPFFRDLTECEAVGIRLRDGEDYPYYETIGFPAEFVLSGNSLCVRDRQGVLLRDEAGRPRLRCICGEVISGHLQGTVSGLTEHGSYWTARGIPAAPADDRQPRSSCHAERYQSVALIPLQCQGERIGLFQFSDRRPGLMSAQKIGLYENLVDYICIALSKLRTDEALLEASQFNQQVIDGAQEGIIVYGRDLHYQVWNPYMEQFTGVPASEALGRHPLELFPFLKGAGVVDKLEKALAGETSSPVEFPFSVEESGRSGWAVDSRAPLRNAQGEIIGVIGTVRDITAQRHLEEQLRQAQKMEAIGQLAGGVAHDFNNVLQVIMGYSSLLEADPKLEERQKNEVRQILLSAERAARLTKGLLAFSRKQVMEPKRVNLCDVVHHVEKFLARIIGEDIDLKIGTGEVKMLPVVADSGHIEQVLINLATNARDAMSKGGSLTLNLAPVEFESPIENPFGHAEPGRYACVTMADTGCGMDDVTRSKIFEPFFTTKEVGKGTGLGMAIVYGIIKQHNGFINVYSEPGIGTTFRIYLPLAEADEAAADARAEFPPPRGGTETLLLAEDDAEVRKLMVTVLTKFGYEVIEAEDGQQAVELFAAERDRIAMVIMDMIMPKKNGMEAGAEIAGLQPDVKVLYSSGYTSDFMENRGVSEQGVHLIMKPVQPVELLRKIRELLD